MHVDDNSQERWASALILPSLQPEATLSALPPHDVSPSDNAASSPTVNFSLSLRSDDAGAIIPFSSFDAICAEHGSVELSDPLQFPRNLYLVAPPGSADLPSTPFQPILDTATFRRLLEEPYRNGRNAVLCLQQSAASDDGGGDEAGRSTVCPHELMIGTPDAFGLLPLTLKMVYELVAPSLPSADVAGFVEVGGEQLIIQTSFVALTTNTVLDLSDGVPDDGTPRVTSIPRIDLLEGVGPHLLTGSMWQFAGEKRMMSRTLDDALETLDIGLDALAHAVDTNVVRGEEVCTLIFTVYFHTPRHSSSLTIVNLGQDEPLLKWFHESVTAAANAAAPSVAPTTTGSIDKSSDSFLTFVPRPFHHQAATLLIPIICGGDVLVGHIAAPPSVAPEHVSIHRALQGRWTAFQSAVDNAACCSNMICTCVTQRPPLADNAFRALLDVWRHPTSTSAENGGDGNASANSSGIVTSSGNDALLPPLPLGWEAMMTDDGRTYYVDHIHRCTTWEHPCRPHGDEDDEDQGRGGSSSSRESSAGRQYITTPINNSSEGNDHSAGHLFSVDHDKQCWGGGEGSTTTMSEVSLMIMDPDMIAPRVILSGSRDVSAIVEKEIASASANTPRVAVGMPSFMPATSDQAVTETPTAKLFASPEHGNHSSNCDVSVVAAVSAGLMMSPSTALANGAGEVISCGDMHIVVPAGIADELRTAGGGATTLTDDAVQSISTTNFIEGLARSISCVGSVDGPDAERDTAVLEDVKYYLARPSTDDEKIESFLFELESILKRSVEAEMRTKQLELENAELHSKIQQLSGGEMPTSEVTDGSASAAQNRRSVDHHEIHHDGHASDILKTIAQLAASVATNNACKGVEIILGAATTTQASPQTQTTSIELSPADVIVNIVDELLQEHQRLTIQLAEAQDQVNNRSEANIIATSAMRSLPTEETTSASGSIGGDDGASSAVNEMASDTTITVVKHRQLLAELDQAMYKKHVDIVARLCEKQKDVIHNLYSDFDASLKEAHHRNEELELQLKSVTAELEGWKHRMQQQPAIMRQRRSPELVYRPEAAVAGGATGAVFEVAALGLVQEPSPSLRRWDDEGDDEDDGKAAERISDQVHAVQSVVVSDENVTAMSESDKRGDSQHVRLSLFDTFKETDSEHDMLVREDRSNDVLLNDQAQLLARIQRYRSRQIADANFEADEVNVSHQLRRVSSQPAPTLNIDQLRQNHQSPLSPIMPINGAHVKSNAAAIRAISPTLPHARSPSAVSANHNHSNSGAPLLLSGLQQQKRTQQQQNLRGAAFTNPVTAVDLLMQRYSNIQQLMSESQRTSHSPQQQQQHAQFLASADEMRQYSTTRVASRTSSTASPHSTRRTSPNATRPPSTYSSPINAAELMKRGAQPPLLAVGKSSSPLAAVVAPQKAQRSTSRQSGTAAAAAAAAAAAPPVNQYKADSSNLFCIPGSYRQVHSPKRLVRSGQGSDHALLRVPNSRSTSAGAHEIDPYAYRE
jgi:hypothetical protein